MRSLLKPITGVSAMLAAWAMPQTTEAAVILAVGEWRSSNGTDPSAYGIQDGVDMTTTRSGTSSTGASANPGTNSDGSTDGTVGSFAAAGLGTGNAYRWVNGAQTATFDFSFTDTSGGDRILTTFHFDGGTNRPNVAQDWELFDTTGGGEVSLGSGTIPLVSGGAAAEYTDFDVSLGDIEFDASSTVNLSLRFTRSDSSTNFAGHHGFLDNVGLSADPVPEPSSMALLGLGALGLIRRRR